MCLSTAGGKGTVALPEFIEEMIDQPPINAEGVRRESPSGREVVSALPRPARPCVAGAARLNLHLARARPRPAQADERFAPHRVWSRSRVGPASLP